MLLFQRRWRHWNEAISTEVLQKLYQHQPKARLSVEDVMQSSYAGLPDKVHVDTFTRLLGFTSLYLIDIKLGENESRITTLLKNVIISCRNLKVLRLDMSGPLSVWYFTAEQGNKFPPSARTSFVSLQWRFAQ